MHVARSLIAAALAAGLTATAGAAEQSVHAPASAAAQSIHELGIAMYIGAGVITLLVVAAALVAIARTGRPVRAGWFVLGGGIVLPCAVLTLLLTAAIMVGDALSRTALAPVARIEVIGHQWWWEVRYLPPPAAGTELGRLLARLCGAGVAERARAARDDGGAVRAIVLANELRLPVGYPVEVELTTRDVIHSFWVPALGGKIDMIPGRVNRLVLHAERAGTFRGQCAEYCGGPHGLMGLVVVAHEEADYRAWLANQAEPARKPAGDLRVQGQAAFLRAGCDECHTIRGTSAGGARGPDLTHVGSRRTLAAGTLDNHVGTLAGWIADPQNVKPGNRMPPGKGLQGSELRALAAYLASLE